MRPVLAQEHSGIVARALLLTIVFFWIYSRMPALSPPSLWLDDLWVAVLVEYATLEDLLALKAPVPPGFIMIQKLIVALLGDTDLVFQLLPVAAGALSIVMMAVLANFVFRNVLIGCSCGLLLAGNALFMEYAIRIKQYSLDALVTILVLFAFLTWREHVNTRNVIGVVSVVLLGQCLSFQAVLIVVITFGLSIVTYMASTASPGRTRFACAAVIFSLTYYWFFTRHYSNERILDFWGNHYFPWEQLNSVPQFLLQSAKTVAKNSFPAGFAWLVFLGLAGTLFLLWDERRRFVGLTIVLMCLSLICLAAAHKYPMAGGRTDIFMLPVVMLAVGAGVAWMSRILPATPALFFVFSLFISSNSILHAHSKYPENHNREVVEKAVEIAKADDALVIFPYANWAVARYGKWPVHLDAADSTNNFYSFIERPNTLMLTEKWEGRFFENDPEVIPDQLRRFISNDYTSVVYVKTSGLNDSYAEIVRILLSRGFTISKEIVRGKYARLTIFSLETAD